MAKYKKPKRMSRKELREQDEVMSKLQLVYAWLAKYRNLLLVAAGGLVVLLLGISLVVSMVESADREQSAAFFKILDSEDGTKGEAVAAYLSEHDGDDLSALALLIQAAEEGKSGEVTAKYLQDEDDSTMAPVLVDELGVAALQQGDVAKAREWFGKLTEGESPYFKALGHARLGDLSNPAFPAGDGKSVESARSAYEAGMSELTADERDIKSGEQDLFKKLEREIALLN